MVETTLEPETLETPTVIVRSIREGDLDAITDIDAASSHRKRPQYFRMIFQRSTRLAEMQMSLVAESEGRVVGFVIASVYYGEYGIVEPAASIDAIGVALDLRGRGVGHALLRQLRANLGALGVTTFRSEVSWSDFDLLAFFESEGFVPAARLCLECRITPTDQ
jgi:predicted N-acetyltransferase YhbS